MTHQTGPKNGGRQKIQKPLTGAGWGKVVKGGSSRESFCCSSFVKKIYGFLKKMPKVITKAIEILKIILELLKTLKEKIRKTNLKS